MNKRILFYSSYYFLKTYRKSKGETKMKLVKTHEIINDKKYFVEESLLNDVNILKASILHNKYISCLKRMDYIHYNDSEEIVESMSHYPEFNKVDSIKIKTKVKDHEHKETIYTKSAKLVTPELWDKMHLSSILYDFSKCEYLCDRQYDNKYSIYKIECVNNESIYD